MNRISDRSNVVIWQHHAGGGFDMRREYDIGLLSLNRGHDLLEGSRNKGRLVGVALQARLQYRRLRPECRPSRRSVTSDN